MTTTAMQRNRAVLISILVGFLLVGFVWAGLAWQPRSAAANTAANNHPTKMEAALIEALASEEMVRVVVLLDGGRVSAETNPTPNTLVNQLQSAADVSQHNILQQVARFEADGDIIWSHSYWVVNALAVEGTPAAIEALAERSDVREIILDEWIDLLDTPQLLDDGALNYGEAWGLDAVNAAQVWHGLGLTGENVTIGVLDTGADFDHPDLVENYRGNLGDGQFEHKFSWHDASSLFVPQPPVDFLPFDPVGHGTAVLGVAVGQNGIGIAPNAEWISARIFNNFGQSTVSIILDGLEWMMAPANDPSLAPDIINGSWGGAGTSTVLLEAVAALREAGIITVFSAGNSGPQPETVGSPASFEDVIAVGSSDIDNTVSWFSSRGPSPLTDEIRPIIIAPGAQILTTQSGGGTTSALGTSFSSPLVAGALALLLENDPTLTQAQLSAILTETATPVSTTQPTTAAGWGILDTYAAAAAQFEGGRLRGTVVRAGQPIANGRLLVQTPAGAIIDFPTDAEGGFDITLQAGTYTVFASAPLAQDSEALRISLAQGETQTLRFDLSFVPSGLFAGRVVGADGAALAAQVRVNGGDFMVDANMQGEFELRLPVGVHQVIVEMNGWESAEFTLPVNTNPINRTITLNPLPTVLLVDSGVWAYDSQIDVYRTALDDLQVGYDEWRIPNPFADAPTLADLNNYDTVIWSDPQYSPGVVFASQVISRYLNTGGNLLVTGPRVGLFDGTGFSLKPWFYNQLQARYMGFVPSEGTLSEANSPYFDGITLDFGGATTSPNHTQIEQVEPLPWAYSQSIFLHEDGTAAGLQAGLCQPHRLLYFGFGLEGVSGADTRRDLLAGAFDYFAAPPNQAGINVETPHLDEFVTAGDDVTYTVTVRNLSETMTDTFDVSLWSEAWSTRVMTQTLTLGPCKRGHTTVTFSVPTDLVRGSEHRAQIKVTSRGEQPVSAEWNTIHRTPKQILFIDDDRWHDNEAIYTNTLRNMGADFDYWNVGWDDGIRGSVPSAILNQYDMVIWYTGGDWFLPLNETEADALYAYMAQGGRLFLTSQDFLFHNFDHPLTREFLGVQAFVENVAPTVAWGSGDGALPRLNGRINQLSYGNLNNFTDGLVPQPQSSPHLFTDRVLPSAVATAGDDWRTVFWSIPLETLPPYQASQAIGQVVGWLSDLGDSTFTADHFSADSNSTQTFVLTVTNSADAHTNTVKATITIPQGLLILDQSMPTDTFYNPLLRTLTWQGVIPSGGQHTISYQAQVDGDLPVGTKLDTTAQLWYERHNLTFERTARMRVHAPDLRQSGLHLLTEAPQLGDTLTYKAHLQNDGAEGIVTATLYLPQQTTILPDTIHHTSGEATLLPDNRIQFSLFMEANESHELVVDVASFIQPEPIWAAALLTIEDDFSGRLTRDHQIGLSPYQSFFPIVIHQQ